MNKQWSLNSLNTNRWKKKTKAIFLTIIDYKYWWDWNEKENFMCFSYTSNITMTAKMAKPDFVTLPTVDEYQPWVTEGRDTTK